MVADTKLAKYATAHEMSNQQSLKPDLPQHKPEPPWKNQWIGCLQASNVTVLLCAISIYDHFRQCWLVAVPKLCIFLGQLHLL